MPRVAARDILEVAAIAGYGVALVEPDCPEMADAALQAALAEEAPVALAVAPDVAAQFIARLDDLMNEVKIPAYLHALPGHPLSARELAELGVSSLAVDFSALSPEENLKKTQAAVEQAHAAGLWAQAALGWKAMDFDPDKGATFARDSGCNVLAVDPGVGALNLDVLRELANRLITFPLAVEDPVAATADHAQGQAHWLGRTAHMGLCQVNFTQQMRQAKDQDGIQAATERLRELMRSIGSTGRW